MSDRSELAGNVVKALIDSSLGYAELISAVSKRTSVSLDDLVTDSFNGILAWVPSINDTVVAGIRQEVANVVCKTANLMLDQIDLLQHGVFSGDDRSPVGIVRTAICKHETTQELILKEYWDKV